MNWYFTNAGDGSALWHSSVDNWNSAADGSGSPPPEIPWASSATRGDDLYPATGFTGTIGLSGEVDGGTGTCYVPINSYAGYPMNGGNYAASVATAGDILAGTFTGNVTVSWSGTIQGGSFYGSVDNQCQIYAGTFWGTVSNEYFIYAGTFHAAVSNGGGINNGTFFAAVHNYNLISNGTFLSDVYNSGEVDGGTFYTVYYHDSGATYGGTFLALPTPFGLGCSGFSFLF